MGELNELNNLSPNSLVYASSNENKPTPNLQLQTKTPVYIVDPIQQQAPKGIQNVTSTKDKEVVFTPKNENEKNKKNWWQKQSKSNKIFFVLLGVFVVSAISYIAIKKPFKNANQS